jgi:hypothetical protein
VKKNLLSIVGLIIVCALLTACTSSATPQSDTATSGNAEAVATNSVSATEAPAAAAGDCLVGSWNLTDFTSYMDSIKSNISKDSSNDVTFTSGDFSGKATFVFNTDHTSSLVTDNFSQSFSMAMKISDQTMDIPITLTINGTSTSDYSTDADKITFSNQNGGDMLITIDVAGSATTMDQSMFGEPGTQKLYQYACVDANTLSLKVIAIDNMDLAPLMLTRVQ